MGSPGSGRSWAGSIPSARRRSTPQAGAAALSVVVEPEFFFGSYELLARCRESARHCRRSPRTSSSIRRQLDEAVAAGASAVLLVAALYSLEQELAGWANAARRRGLAPAGRDARPLKTSSY